MSFDEPLEQAIVILQRRGRVSYRALKREFGVDDDFLEDLKGGLIEVHGLAVDQNGKMLVWTGEPTPKAGPLSSPVPTPEASLPIEQASVPAPHPPDLQTQAEAVGVQAERRQLTVMFCDLVGSTPLSERLDPEDLREVVRAYQTTAADVICRLEGHIAQYLGDGLLVYFGYPRAHEDDARRAVRTGLEIIQAIGTLSAGPEPDTGARLAVRIGIHTGLVVVGEVGGGSQHGQLALGETPNVAARIQGSAEPNTVVISAATAHLLHSTFALEELGTRCFKGMAEPMAVSRVVNLLEEYSAEADAAPAAARFLVGRDEELGLLRRCWQQSKEGLGQTVLINGEAGIGKTALSEALRDLMRQEGHMCVMFRCSPYHQNSPLYPILQHLEALFPA